MWLAKHAAMNDLRNLTPVICDLSKTTFLPLLTCFSDDNKKRRKILVSPRACKILSSRPEIVFQQ